MIDEPLLKMQQVCELTGYSDKTIRRAVATVGRHGLHAIKLRGEWRFRPADVQTWIASYETS